ncbi:50S ribosomal protein L18 [Candidatus Micrarchaeota archaeon]|nr:MAG: 50S ribosomal protein L18 [Candidatus Micrarchaeota archaeon]
MAHKTIYKLRRRRRREGKTNYRKRLALIKSKKPRLVARVLSRSVVAQIVSYRPEGDATIVNTTSLELKNYGWNGHNGNIAAAYLTGFLCGKKALKKGIKEAILDIGLHTPVKGSKVFAVLKGAVDAGLKIPHDEKTLPSDETVRGKTIEKYRGKSLNVDSVIKEIENKVK